MDNFVNSIMAKLSTGTQSTSAIYGRSRTIGSPWGKTGFNMLAWFMSGLLLLALVGALAAMVYYNVVPEHLSMLKDMFTAVGYIFLASTWVSGSSFILYLLFMVWDDWVLSTAKHIFFMMFNL
ncbi:MAG: hypothetical protein EON60_11500 [Alphaproteobacteria bacterium]|nr:MAG: hypothetical protein EON60_11500 [Alphaproteobacteria bacterium]